MRKGTNPAKTNGHIADILPHRVILPVYIPNLEGYFEHALEILQLCLDSLYLSSCGRIVVTVISNDCAPEIVRELQRYHNDGVIEQLVLNRQNRGKVDAVVSVARGSFEELITISDSDVLFKPGWIDAVETIFRTFPESGFVAPVPGPSAWYYTSATVLGGLLQRELSLEAAVAIADLEQLDRSIGRKHTTLPAHYKTQLIIKRNGISACVGSGHFVFTIRRAIVSGIPEQPSLTALSGKSEELWLDLPPDTLGYWRLSTIQMYAYHMGNTPELWMHQAVESFRNSQSTIAPTIGKIPDTKRHITAWMPLRLRQSATKLVRYLVFKCKI